MSREDGFAPGRVASVASVASALLPMTAIFALVGIVHGLGIAWATPSASSQSLRRW